MPPKSRYAMGSAANMFRSLVVILALMLGLIFLVPRVNSLSGPVVDIHATAVDVKAQSGWPIVEPRGLPAGWTPTGPLRWSGSRWCSRTGTSTSSDWPRPTTR